MKRKLLLTLIALCCIVVQAWAYDFSAVCSGKTLYFTITDATNRYVKITYPGSSYSNGWSGYTKPSGTLTIPSSVTNGGTTYTVTEIGAFAFYQCTNLSGNLVIPNSIITIGSDAFNGCWQYTGTLTIGSSVTSIGGGAFNQTSFTTVYYNATNCSSNTYSQSPFSNCQVISTVVFGSNVQKIPNYLFKGCTGIGSLSLPNSLTYIGTSAFEGCSGLRGNLSIPSSVTSIGAYAFEGCSGLTGNLNIPNITSINSGTFKGCSGFSGSLVIPNTVTTIQSYAFNGCSGFSSLSISNSVSTIEQSAFATCSGFSGSLNIPQSVTSIGDYAFGGCSGFTGSLTIPQSVTSIGNGVFANCSFNTVYFNPTECTTTGPLMMVIGYQSCYSLTKVVIGNNVKSIPNFAFYDCKNLSSIYLGSSLNSIGEVAFGYCGNVSYIYSDAVNPPTTSSVSFEDVPKTISIYVPCGSESLYQQATVWSVFPHIFGHPNHILTVSPQHTAKGTAEVTQVPTCGNNVPAIVLATAKIGYEFLNWTENGVVFSTENPYSFTLSNDRNLVANFTNVPYYTISVSANSSEAGTVTGGGTFNEGTEITVRATPNSNYVFLYWKEGYYSVSTNAEYTFIQVSQVKKT